MASFHPIAFELLVESVGCSLGVLRLSLTIFLAVSSESTAFFVFAVLLVAPVAFAIAALLLVSRLLSSLLSTLVVAITLS